ncbi:MAG TPA: PASTA domain-containing protein, partial [Exilispira sp.]|nr:PASTA domain-containing protein [Exilispira sp.]
MPDFKDMRVVEAAAQIQQLNLIVQIESRYSNFPYGQIISQSPAHGHALKEKSFVKLVVSRGLESSYLDDFTGQNLFYVEKRLQELSLSLKRDIKIAKVEE